MSTSVSKIVAERNHRILMELVSKPGNDTCADCKARAPRWASHNLGIFICVNCASIHRKIGTHITKVKSITLDEWTKEQVEVMKEKGNVKSNEVYNPNEARHPPPTNMIDSERDSELEKFIRAKYELKRFMFRKSTVSSQPVVAESRTAPAALRSRSTPLTDTLQIGRASSPGPPPPPKTPENLPPSFKLYAVQQPPTRSASQPLPPLSTSDKLAAPSSLRPPTVTQPSAEKPKGQVWEDLISLQGPSQHSSLPLQYSPMNSISPLPSQPPVLAQQQPRTPGNPFTNLSLGQSNMPSIASPISAVTPDLQFPFAHTIPLPSPSLHLSASNPFNHTPLPSPSVMSVSGTAFPLNTNPFSSSMPLPMGMSTPSTPSTQPFMALPIGPLSHTPPLPYVPSQVSTPSFTSTPFFSAPTPATAGLVQNPYMPGTPAQAALTVPGTTNPFTAMQMGQVGLSRVSPQSATAAPVFLNQQQPGSSHAFGGWSGQHGTF